MQENKNKLLKTLAIAINKHRGEKSISKLCNEIDLSKSIWSELEKGKKDIQFTTFYRIAEALDIKPSFLLSEIEQAIGADFSFFN